MFRKVLIANRGEIALRIHRACKEMGVATVAIHSTADADAMHVRLADESVCIGPENAGFVRIVEDHGLTFIGPTAEHISVMGDKIAAKDTMRKLGVPCVPGSDGEVATLEEAMTVARDMGFPVIVKASAGGGGRGMKMAPTEADLSNAFFTAKSESKAAFGDDAVYIEKYLGNPRHIEIQVFGDGKGRAVHLGERDCSLQRRHQKVLEECPSPVIDAEQRARIGKVCAEAVARINYRGAGTIEFLYEDGEFYFIEMNTRLQVEHPVTEAVYRVDLVKEQLRVAAGLDMSFTQENLIPVGHSIECRINAEKLPNFSPSPGTVTAFHAPGGLGVRMDSAIYDGYRIPPHYDSLIGKLIVHAEDRPAALARLDRALSELIVDGVATTAPLFDALVHDPDVISGDYNIAWLERWLERMT